MHREQGFQGSENIPYDIIRVDTYHYVIDLLFVKAALGVTHRTFYIGKNKGKKSIPSKVSYQYHYEQSGFRAQKL